MKLINSNQLDQPIDSLFDNIRKTSEGRFQICAVAHSRFVGQLAEWAVFERVSPQDVDLQISVRLPSRTLSEIHS